MIAEHFDGLEAVTSTKHACALVGASRSTLYRRRRPALARPARPRPEPINKLSEPERQHILACCAARSTATPPRPRCGPGCSTTASTCARSRPWTGYWLPPGSVGNGRRQRTHPARQRPELVARRPNQVWSWDITKLQGPQRGVYYALFVIMDVFGRYVVGWMVSPAETGELAQAFIADALARQGIERDQLSLHADRGTSMTSKPVAQLLVDLGVAPQPQPPAREQ